MSAPNLKVSNNVKDRQICDPCPLRNPDGSDISDLYGVFLNILRVQRVNNSKLSDRSTRTERKYIPMGRERNRPKSRSSDFSHSSIIRLIGITISESPFIERK